MRLRRAACAAAAASMIVLLGTACGERSEPTGATVSFYPVTVRGAGDRPLAAERPAERIAVLSPGPRAILQALGARSQIAGAPIGRNGEILFPRLVRLRPDLIVASADTGEVALSRAADASHASVYQAPDGSVREVEQAITQLGLLTGRPVDGRRLVARIERQRRIVREKVGRDPRVTVFVDTGLFTTVSDQSLIGNLIREAGGENVAADSPSAGSFDLDELRRLDPQVFLATSGGGTTLADLRRDARTRALTAVREGRFAVVPSSLLLPGPQIGEGLLRLARLLHPDAFQ